MDQPNVQLGVPMESVAHMHVEKNISAGKKHRIIHYKIYVFASLLYLLVALLMFYPITLNISSVIPGSGGDAYKNLWDIWWVNYATFQLHTSVYYTNLIFWPVGANLIYGTIAPFVGFLSAPFQVVSLMFAYNVMFFLGFVLSGLTMFILADYLIKNKYAAFVAGFIFSFSAFHIAQSYGHIHLMNLEWTPLFVYFFLRILHEERDYKNVVGMSASFALATLMGETQQSLMLGILLVLMLIAFIVYKGTRKNILNKRFAGDMLLFVVSAFLLGSFAFIPVISSIAAPNGLAIANYQNDVTHNLIWSNNLLAFFVPSYYNGVFYGAGTSSGIYSSIYFPGPTERVAYMSYTALALAALAIYKQRKTIRLWIALGIIFAWLSTGPYLQIGGWNTMVPGPFYIYNSIPFINIIREPGRFDLIFTMITALIAGYGFKNLLESTEKMKDKSMLYNSHFIVAAIVVLLFLENNGMPLNTGLQNQVVTYVSVPKIYPELSRIAGNFSILELPALPNQNSTTPALYPGKATFYTAITHKPILGGYVGRNNVTQLLSIYNIPLVVQDSNLQSYGSFFYPSPVVQNYTNQTLLSLYNYNTAFVVLDKSAYTRSTGLALIGYLIKTFGPYVYNDNTTIAFQTANAINASLFRSYVAYPLLTEWQAYNTTVVGSNNTFYRPVGPGMMTIYAPYQNPVQSQQTQFINTTVRLVAIAGSPTTLTIATPGQQNVQTLAKLNVSITPTTIRFKLRLVSGPQGNILFFISSDQSIPVYVSNITLSRWPS